MNKLLTITLVLFAELLILGYDCSAQKVKGYELIWSDEFSSDSLNLDIWNYRALGARRASINSKESIIASKKDGVLKIKTFLKEGKVYTGMISTVKKLDQKYGYYECRFKMDNVFRGYWPAFWLQSRDFGKTLNPEVDGMEVDIFEFYTGNPLQYENAVHWNGYAENHKSLGNKRSIKTILDGKFHVAGLEWTPDSYKFYFDGELVWEVNEPISQKEQYIILSTEVEVVEPFEKLSGDQSVNFEVDYVRVYQKKEKRSFFKRLFNF